MHYTPIPNTDLEPAAICLGSTHIGSAIGPDSAFKLLDAYLDRGGNFIDTASVYANWLPGERSISEKTIGRWLRRRGCRDRIILATKGAHPELSTMHIGRLSPAEIVQDLNDSLRNLQTGQIDLYWLHRDDPARPVEEILDALNDQVKAGKIRYFGCSNWQTGRIKAAQAYAARRGLQGFVANQMMWSLARVDPANLQDKTLAVMDEPMKAYHRQAGLAAIPYSSQANGFFQKMAAGALDRLKPNQQQNYGGQANLRRGQRVKELAAATGLSVTQIVLGYLQSQPFPTIPIVGCRTVAQLEDSLTAAGVRLTPEQLQYLEQDSSEAIK